MSKADYLLSIESVRPRCKIVFEKALVNQLTNFDVDLSKLDGLVDYTIKTIQDDFGTAYDKIPPHGRWQHFEAGGVPRIDQLVGLWPDSDKKEVTTRLIDLFLVSVLLDAGAGKHWKYVEKGSGQVINRSEGLATACYHMFKDGLFSSLPDQDPYRVDGKALVNLNEDAFKAGMQVSDSNPLEGFNGRLALLNRLGKALQENKQLFGPDARPGYLVDYLLSHEKTIGRTVPLTTLWDALMKGLGPIWPQEGRTKLDGVVLGDTWPCSSMPHIVSDPSQSLVPFHKLTQWLCYSLLTPIKKYLDLEFVGESLQTGLPEYRNGGLLVDMGVLTLKPSAIASASSSSDKSASSVPVFPVESDVIVEWRAVTVGFLDLILDKVNAKLGSQLSLPQLLEAGTWKAGRRIAAELRPVTNGPPIDIISDGTVF
ncbi:hypothetical protein AWJ20_1405 [Sugiyamaella lignohabitans]|uniref:Uracil catabolism protein 4 n=1 Tax=Sugiyamaella lignohabitans TaxID=796027 RepID=A0A167DP39_9ASCO|nr:uncharacterized protein AWJ20_1405 [Sugiyamaella lignohabitans]ANB13124.1 hypothetical protein AWJ20_1405 [Sugiyamaella lignohabitans]